MFAYQATAVALASAETTILEAGILPGARNEGCLAFILDIRMKRDRLFIITSISVGTALLASMLSLLFSVVMAPLPFPQADRIITVATMQDGSPVSSSFLDYRDLSKSGGPVENSIYVQSMIGNTEIGAHPETLYNVRFEGDLFSVFQKQPAMGDVRDLDSRRQQATPAALLSYAAWTKVFGNDPHALGKLIHIGSNLYEIRAVLSPEYQLVLPADIWVAARRKSPGDRASRDGRIYARLTRGVSLAATNGYLQSLASSLQKQAPDSNEGVTFQGALLRDSIAGQSKLLLYLLALGAAGVFSVAYFNVYQLLAAKAAAASPRWSLCVALGASRRRLFQAMLREPLLLSLAGCTIGLFLSILSTQVLRALSPTDIPRVADTRLVWQVGLASFVISILAAALFASLVLMRTLSLETTTASLHGGVRGGASIRHAFGAGKQVLLIAQIALSTTLLIAMGMLAAALRQATASPLGFDAQGVSVTDIDLKEPTDTSAGSQYVRQIMQHVSSLPGVLEVATSSIVPFQGRSYNATFTSGEMRQPSGRELQFAAVSPEFFQALQIRLLRGRSFLDSDNGSSPRVAILNQAAAQSLFGGVDSLNKQIRAELGRSASSAEVVGIVENVRQDPTNVLAPPIVYLPLPQVATYSVSLILRASTPVENSEIKSAIWSMNANQAVQETVRLVDLIDLSLSRIRYTAFLMTLFASVTMLLSALGIYAAVAQWLSTSQQEIALRLAFGATYSQIRGSILARIMAITALALVAGMLASMAASNTIRSLLYGVQPQLGTVLLATALLLGAVAFLASYIPALRSKFIDPVQLLRAE